MSNFLITRYATYFEASKNVDYRKRMHYWFSIFVNFLQENNLTTRCLLSDVENIPEDFEVRRNDLTDEGFELIEEGFDRWLGGLDRRKSPPNTSILEKALKEIRNKAASSVNTTG
jgi:hypothetical protein